MVENHEELSEEIQNFLAYVGELIDGYAETMTVRQILSDLYEWLEQIMVDHYEICNSVQ